MLCVYVCVRHYNVITANATLSVRCKMYENYSQASLALSVQRIEGAGGEAAGVDERGR